MFKFNSVFKIQVKMRMDSIIHCHTRTTKFLQFIATQVWQNHKNKLLRMIRTRIDSQYFWEEYEGNDLFNVKEMTYFYHWKCGHKLIKLIKKTKILPRLGFMASPSLTPTWWLTRKAHTLNDQWIGGPAWW